MSNEKQQLINAIETLPDNLASQAYNYIEYLKLSYVDEKAPESITIKSKKDLQKKLQEVFDDEHYFSRIKLNRGANEGNIKNNL